MKFKEELSQQLNSKSAQKTRLDNNKAPISSASANRLNAYRNEIKHTRQQRGNQMRLKKDLTEKILLNWKELKEIRSKQKFRNTDIKLVIKKCLIFKNFFSTSDFNKIR